MYKDLIVEVQLSESCNKKVVLLRMTLPPLTTFPHGGHSLSRLRLYMRAIALIHNPTQHNPGKWMTGNFTRVSENKEILEESTVRTMYIPYATLVKYKFLF